MELPARTGYSQFLPPKHSAFLRPESHTLRYFLRFVAESLDSIRGRSVTIMNGKAERTEEQNGRLAERYRAVLLFLCGPINEQGNSPSKILFHLWDKALLKWNYCRAAVTALRSFVTGRDGTVRQRLYQQTLMYSAKPFNAVLCYNN